MPRRFRSRLGRKLSGFPARLTTELALFSCCPQVDAEHVYISASWFCSLSGVNRQNVCFAHFGRS